MNKLLHISTNSFSWLKHQFNNLDYRGALVFYTLFMILWYSPFLFLGQVIAPRLDPTITGKQVELITANDTPFITRSFPTNPSQHADYHTIYVPDIAGEINEPHYHWINTWIASFGLGQALVPLQRGLSVTLFPAFIVSLFTENPFVLATFVTISFHFLAGFVFTDYMRLLKLHPIAALSGGIIYGTQAPFSYFPTQNPFTLPLVFIVILVYLLHRIAYDRHWVWTFLLVISVQSTIQAAYLQSQVYIIYIVIAYIVYLYIYHIHTQSNRLHFMMRLLIGGFIGVAMTIPVMLDFVHNALNSARTPVVSSQIATIYFNELHITLGYFVPALFDRSPSPFGTTKIGYLIAKYLTSVITIFSLYGVITSFKRSWGWFVLLVFMIVVSMYKPVALFFMQYFSANISSWGTFYHFFSLFSIIILCTYGIDAAIRVSCDQNNQEQGKPTYTIARVGVFILMSTILALYLQAGINAEMKPRWIILVFEVLILSGFIFVTQPSISQRIRSLALVSMVMLTSLVVLFPAIPRQPANDMMLVSEEFQVIRDTLKPDEYQANVSSQSFDEISWKCCLYNGGHNNTYGFNSIHGNFLLPSKIYVDLMANFGYESGEYDKLYKYKHYFSIKNNYDSLDFWMMNIGVVVSHEEQNHPNMTLISKVNRWYIYRNNAKGCCIQIPLDAIQDNASTPSQVMSYISTNLDPRQYTHNTLTKSERYSDYFVIPLVDNNPSLVLISQSYHDFWQAEVLVNQRWARTDTIAVNGKYLGAFTPRDATSVRFTFRPWALWVWIPHSIWAIGILAIIIHRPIDNYLTKRKTANQNIPI